MVSETNCCLCLSLSDVKLGSFIPNIQEPDIDALSLPDNDQYSVKVVKRNWLCTTPAHIRSEAAPCPKTPTLHERTLGNASGLFKRLCEEEKVQAWLQEQMEHGNDVHFVVGLRTLPDPTASSEGMENDEKISGLRVKRVLYSSWGRLFNWFFGSFDIRDVRMERDSWWIEIPNERWLFGKH